MGEATYGYAGKLLRIDLSAPHIFSEPTASHAARFIGGRTGTEHLLE